VLAALGLCQGEAKALLVYNIYQSGGDVVVRTSGSLDLSSVGAINNDSCGNDGTLFSAFAAICTGPDANLNLYAVAGSSAFDGTVFDVTGVTFGGISTIILGDPTPVQLAAPVFGITPGYVSGTPIISSSVFIGRTLYDDPINGLGFTPGTTGLIGTWTITGTGEAIYACLGPDSCVPSPAPLPVLGASAAFGWSRRLRRRLRKGVPTSPGA
jgi:hypothetical protein